MLRVPGFVLLSLVDKICALPTGKKKQKTTDSSGVTLESFRFEDESDYVYEVISRI